MSPTKTGAICSHCLRGQHPHCTVPDTCECPTCNPADEASDGVVWEDPPAASRGPLAKKTFPVDALRAHPKRWAKVETFTAKSTASSVAGRFRKGVYGDVAPPPIRGAERPHREGIGALHALRRAGR